MGNEQSAPFSGAVTDKANTCRFFSGHYAGETILNLSLCCVILSFKGGFTGVNFGETIGVTDSYNQATNQDGVFLERIVMCHTFDSPLFNLKKT